MNFQKVQNINKLIQIKIIIILKKKIKKNYLFFQIFMTKFQKTNLINNTY